MPVFTRLAPRRALHLSALLLIAGCVAPREVTQEVTHEVTAETVAEVEPAPISLDGWPAETFALPPGFAPELPTGSESLLFSPGWRDPTAEGFWSYAFVMSIDEPAPDAARVDELLELYYSGLMEAFARGDLVATIGDSVSVDVVQHAPNHFEAEMHLIDAFATLEPIALRVLVDTVAVSDERSSVSIRVSAQPKEHEIWRSLEAAIASIRLAGDTGVHAAEQD